MQIKQVYKNEFLALRYSLMSQSKDEKLMKEGYTKLYKLANEIGWYILPGDLRDRAESKISNFLNTLIDPKKNLKTDHLNQAQNDFFTDLLTKDIPNKLDELMDHELQYFKTGNFRSFNLNFMRYVKQLQNANEETINELSVYYVISSAIRNHQAQFLEDIKCLSNFYNLYDYNIYIYLMLLFQGEFQGISRVILSVKQNVSELTFSLVDEEDLSFYFSLCLLADFELSYLKDLLVDNESLAYRLNENFPKNFEILKMYQRAQYEDVINYIDSIKEKCLSDPILFKNVEKLFTLIKKNILKEILKSSSAVKLDYLSKLLKIQNSLNLEPWVFELMNKEKMDIVFDDLEKIVYMKDKNPLEEATAGCINTSQKNMLDFLSKNYICPKYSLNNYQSQNCETVSLNVRGSKAFADIDE